MHLGQLWKLDDTTLINKAGIWRSPNEWNFIHNGDGTIFIENTSDGNKVLGLNGDEVVPEVKVPNLKFPPGQLWIKGEEMAGGYTTLKNYESSKVLTATASGLKAKGNYININYIPVHLSILHLYTQFIYLFYIYTHSSSKTTNNWQEMQRKFTT